MNLESSLAIPLGAHDFGGGLVLEGDEREATVPPSFGVVQQGDVDDLAEGSKVGDQVILGRRLPNAADKDLKIGVKLRLEDLDS